MSSTGCLLWHANSNNTLLSNCTLKSTWTSVLWTIAVRETKNRVMNTFNKVSSCWVMTHETVLCSALSFCVLEKVLYFIIFDNCLHNFTKATHQICKVVYCCITSIPFLENRGYKRSKPHRWKLPTIYHPTPVPIYVNLERCVPLECLVMAINIFILFVNRTQLCFILAANKRVGLTTEPKPYIYIHYPVLNYS